MAVKKNNKKMLIISIKKNIFNYTCILQIGLLFGIISILFTPSITLKGKSNLTISYKDTYIEKGYEANYLFKNINPLVKIDGYVTDGQIGTYQINYKINYGPLTFKKTRNINIIDNIKPIIDAPDSEVICPGVWPKTTYTTNDEYDGDLTLKTEVNVLSDKIILAVNDSSGNTTQKEIPYTYGDNDKPVITLKGDNPMTITTATKYSEPGYTATDNCDGDLTSKVVVTGSEYYRQGEYQRTYKVSDSLGNETTVTRKIIVKNTNLYNSGSIASGTIYLTFDDGPSEGTTNVILDILKQEGIKATFFVTCSGPDYLIKRIYDEGHTVALHTCTHEYSDIYSSVDAYFADLNRVSTRVKNITGYDAKIIRFPGGSSNTISRNYKTGIMTTLTGMVLDRGYRYFDWNVDSMDASSSRNSSDVYYNVVGSLSHSRSNVVLMHDIKSMTRDALYDIIKYGKNNGYTFSRIEPDTYMIRHGVNN